MTANLCRASFCQECHWKSAGCHKPLDRSSSNPRATSGWLEVMGGPVELGEHWAGTLENDPRGWPEVRDNWGPGTRMQQFRLSICGFRCQYSSTTAKRGHGSTAQSTHMCTHVHISMFLHMPHNAHTPLHPHSSAKGHTLSFQIPVSVPVGTSQLCQEHRQTCSSPSLILSSVYERSMFAQREHEPRESRGEVGEVWGVSRHTSNCPKPPSHNHP